MTRPKPISDWLSSRFKDLQDFLDTEISIKDVSIEAQLSQFAKLCDKTVLKRLLKELWKLVINNLEKIVILPPIDNRGLLNLPGSFVVCFCCRGFFFLLVGIKNYTFC